MKAGLNIIHSAWVKVNEMKMILKAFFSIKHHNQENI